LADAFGSEAARFKEKQMEPKLISMAEFCEMVGVKRTTAYKILRGPVRSTKIGSRRLVDKESAENFVRERLEQGGGQWEG
jgi:predicted DNA-binding transcriptional regulator AlpA